MIAKELAERGKQLAEKTQEVEALRLEKAKLQRQVDWFQRQLFGRKSEKRLFESPLQDNFDNLLGEEIKIAEESDDNTTDIPAHKRKKKGYPGTPDDSGLRFNEAFVKPREIMLSTPELDGPDADQYEIIRYESTYRLAQQRSAVEVLLYKRPILKRKDSGTLITPPAPDNVFGKSFADVSFVVGMLVDKFVYHLPLYRQHQRLEL